MRASSLAALCKGAAGLILGAACQAQRFSNQRCRPHVQRTSLFQLLYVQAGGSGHTCKPNILILEQKHRRQLGQLSRIPTLHVCQQRKYAAGMRTGKRNHAWGRDANVPAAACVLCGRSSPVVLRLQPVRPGHEIAAWP